MLTILLIPGAWITPAFYQPFLQALTAEGYEARYAAYPSLDPINPATEDVQVDTEAIESVIRPIVEDEGKDVLLMMHSYAGMPGAAAATGWSKVQRTQQGKAGGVVGMVFIAAFVVPEGVSCAGLQGGSLPSWILLGTPGPDLNLPDNPEDTFAADINNGQTKKLEGDIRPHATLAFTSPQPHPAWADTDFDGRLGFIVTVDDKAVPKEAQYAMMNATGKAWVVKEMDSSHCAPFLGRRHETVQVLKEIINEFPE